MRILSDIVNAINLVMLRLRPALRALVLFFALSVLATAVWSQVFGATYMSLIWGAWLAALMVYFAYRMGYFSPRVMAQLPGDSEPYPHRVRKMPGNFRMEDWDEAQYVDSEEARGHIQPDERVIGIEWQGATVAYPLRAMGLREIANEDIAGTPISVTWSPLTYSARAFVARDPNGNAITLAPTGLTMFNSPLLESDNGTQYLQFTGEALLGPDAGHQLKHFPSTATTWSAWENAWPETEAMSTEGMPERDVYERYYASNRAGLFQQSAKDKALPDKDVVIGLMDVAGNDAGASEGWVYSAHELRDQPLVHETLGDTPVLVVCERGSATYCAFDRTVSVRRRGVIQKVLEFSSHTDNDFRPNKVIEGVDEDATTDSGTPDAGYEPWIITDSETGSKWNAINGLCIEGELKGTILRMLPVRNGFWFAWHKLHSDVALAHPEES